MRGRIFAAGALAAALMAPASALAANTYTVDPGSADGCNAAHTCRTITQAVGDPGLAAGDTIVVNDGTYTEPATVQLNKPGVLLEAKNPGKVTVTQNSSTAGLPVFSIVQGDHLDGLVVNSGVDGGPAVLVKGANTTVSRCTISKQGVSTRDTPVYAVDPTVIQGVNNINHSSVLAAPTAAGQQNSATVSGSKNSTMSLTSVIVFSGQQQGPAVYLPGNDKTPAGAPVPNKIIASVLGAINPGEAGLAVTSNSDDPDAKATEVDSTIITGGAQGAGLLAQSETVGKGQDVAGDISVVLVHTTIAGVKNPFVANANASGASNAVGDIHVTFDRSIVHGSAQGTTSHATGSGIPILDPGHANTVAVTVQNSDTTQLTDTGVTVTGVTNTPDDQLFVNPKALNLHLLGSAPVIDKGGPLRTGESTVDPDNDQRVIGAASDLGADEFVNRPPTASATVSTTTGKQGVPITFDASKSADPDGAPIAKYIWVFGDGTTTTTTTPVTTHAFLLLGDYNGSVTAVDAQGLNSPAFQLPTIRINDGKPPVVAIKTPASSAQKKLYTVETTRSKKGKVKTTKTLNDIIISGTAQDESGVATVELSLRRLHLRGSNTSSKVCITSNGKNPFITTSCKRPPFFPVSFDNGNWTYKLRASQKLRPGTYQVSARATDAKGNVSTPVTSTFQLK